MALQTQVVAVDGAVQSTGDNVQAIIDSLPPGYVEDRTNGTLRVTCDPVRRCSARVMPGDYVVKLTVAGLVKVLVLTAAQYAALITTA